jgi:diguanylate cyclase (GGDEF)-like protein
MTSPAKECNFSPYAQLVAALLPRASGMSLFAPTGELRWTNEEAIGPAAARLALASAAKAAESSEAGERCATSEGHPLYLFWLRDEAQRLTAVFAVSWRAAEADPKSFTYVHAMLRPVLECLCRELSLRAQLGGANVPADDNSDLQMLLSNAATEQQDDAGESVRKLLQSVNKHLQCEFTALLVPERRLATVVKAEGREVDTSVLAKIHRPLLSLGAVRRDAALLNEADSLAGVTLPLRVLSCSLRDKSGRFAGVLALLRRHDAPEFRRREAMLADLLARRAYALVESCYDSLTGLATHRAFEQRAQAMLEQRNAAQRWSALHIDCDRMQAINDNHGMHVGDALLAKLGELISTRLAPGSLAARIAGARLVILLPSTEADAAAFAEALRAGAAAITAQQLGVDDPDLAISISVGVATVDASGDLQQALREAEAACKAAKQQGRNRVEIYNGGITQPAEDGIETALRAVINNRLGLHVQRVAPLRGFGATGFELLLRVLDDNGAATGPAGFITAAARHGLLPEVDRWVVRSALQQLAPQAAQLAAGAVSFSINLSAQSLGDAGLVDFIVQQVEESGVPPSALCFELTESAASANAVAAEHLMQRLRDLGCRIALDNFGTGMLSLAGLRTLPVDMLKIDGCFVRDVLKDPRAASMLQAVAQMARGMQLVTVAQHVETDELRQRVADLGVSLGQGFAIDRPVPFADVLRDLSAHVAATQPGEEIVLSGDDIPAELQDELLATGIMLVEQSDDALSRMEAVLSSYDHTESALYQSRPSG